MIKLTHSSHCWSGMIYECMKHIYCIHNDLCMTGDTKLMLLFLLICKIISPILYCNSGANYVLSSCHLYKLIDYMHIESIWYKEHIWQANIVKPSRIQVFTTIPVHNEMWKLESIFVAVKQNGMNITDMTACVYHNVMWNTALLIFLNPRQHIACCEFDVHFSTALTLINENHNCEISTVFVYLSHRK